MSSFFAVLTGSAAVDTVLAEQVRFRSPYADYAGRADVAHLAGLIRDLLVEVEPLQALHGDGAAMTQFEGRVAGEVVQGVVVEQHDEAGRVVDVMLTLRPYPGLRAAMAAMRERMDASPLPGA
jgi:hypothetical protein